MSGPTRRTTLTPALQNVILLLGTAAVAGGCGLPPGSSVATDPFEAVAEHALDTCERGHSQDGEVHNILAITLEYYAVREQGIQKLHEPARLAIDPRPHPIGTFRGPAHDPEVSETIRPDVTRQVAHLLGFSIGAADQLKRCRSQADGWERCEVAGAHAVVAIGRVLIEADRAAVEVRDWRPAEYPSFAPVQARVLKGGRGVVRLEKRDGLWTVIGDVNPGVNVRTLRDWH
jgi:hypothetical protein